MKHLWLQLLHLQLRWASFYFLDHISITFRMFQGTDVCSTFCRVQTALAATEKTLGKKEMFPAVSSASSEIVQYYIQDSRNYITGSCVTYEQLLTLQDIPGATITIFLSVLVMWVMLGRQLELAMEHKGKTALLSSSSRLLTSNAFDSRIPQTLSEKHKH